MSRHLSKRDREKATVITLITLGIFAFMVLGALIAGN